MEVEKFYIEGCDKPIAISCTLSTNHINVDKSLLLWKRNTITHHQGTSLSGWEKTILEYFKLETAKAQAAIAKCALGVCCLPIKESQVWEQLNTSLHLDSRFPVRSDCGIGKISTQIEQ